MKRSVKIILFLLMSTIFIGCDQVTKELAKLHLKDKASISFWHDAFRLNYVENTGAFLSFGSGWSGTASFWLMSVLPLFFLVGMFIYSIRKTATHSLSNVFPFVLICSGGLGNIIDRIMYDRHVADFMNLGIHNLRTGIFNFADVYVTAGVIMLLFMHTQRS